MARMTRASAIKAINEHGILLVYPVNNKKLPHSLWSVFYPNDEMRWEWDEDGDDRVGKLWQLKTDLATSREVVYAKWYKGRATYFSKEVFVALLALMGTPHFSPTQLRQREGAQILEVLEMDSPQSTKQIKIATDLRGKFFERVYEKSMKELWNRLLIVGFGEFDDGAFPSLAVGSTQTLFEDEWEAAKKMNPAQAKKILLRVLKSSVSLWVPDLEKLKNDSPEL